MTTRGPTVHAHHTTRNPWGPASSSSGSSRTYHCPSDCYQEPADWQARVYSQPARTPSPHYDVIEGPRLNRAALPPLGAPGSERAVTPASTVHTEGAVDPCGGHCTAFENFCHYCLQVLFIAGILTGVSLTVAGSVLRGQKRGGDLMVLVYIGCLTAMVCTLLLSVQCCVRRNVQRRKRARGARGGAIPLQELGGPGPLAPPVLPQPGQYEPLLRRLVQQQIHDENQRYIPEPVNTVVRGDRSGTPWWRRQPPHAHPHPYKLSHVQAQMPL
uniref:Uncharacterized protein n=1 Tax=Homalodisca liturata TaxID=320908 RepID=A0A1B6JHS5_9HEMI